MGARRTRSSGRSVLGAVLVLVVGIGAPAQVGVEVLSPPRTVSPGDVALHVFQLFNPGPDPLEVRLRVEAPPGWTHLGAPEGLFVPAGSEETVFLTVILPRVAPAGRYRVRLVASGAWGESDASAGVEVRAVAAVALVPPEPGQGGPGEAVAYALGVVNQGNVLDRFFVEASSARGWTVRTSPRELALGPGEEGTVQLVLSIPAGAEPGRELVTVSVRSGEGAEARTAWYTAVLPPGPEAVVGTVLSELELRLGGRLEYDPLADRRASVLTLAGGGEVLGGELDLALRLTGPWGASPYRPDRLGVRYEGDWAWVEAGDTDLALSSLVLGVGGRGMSAGLTTDGWAAALFTGWAGREGRFAARGVWSGPWGEVGGALRVTRGEESVQAGALWAAARIGEGLSFRGEGAAGLPGTLLDGGALVGLTARAGPEMGLQVEAYAVGPGVPSPRADRAGFTLSGQLVASPWGLRFTTRWERDNVGGAPFLPTVVRSELTTGADWTAPGWPLALFSTVALRRTQGFGPGPGLDRRTFLVDLAATVGDSPLLLRLTARWRWEGDLVLGTRERVEDYGQRLHLTLGKARATLALTETVTYAAGTVSATAGAALTVRTSPGVSVEFRYSRDGGAAGAELPIQVGALSATARADLVWDGSGTVRSLRGTVGFEYPFRVTPPFLPAKGQLEGVVFLDENGNGRRDPGEAGVAGAVLVADGIQVASGSEGRFRFPPLDPGSYAVTVARLPRGVAPRVDLPLSVELPLAGRVVVAVPCVRLGEIRGLVFNDTDGDGSRGVGEPGVGRVRVVLERDGQEREQAYTDPFGTFAFAELPPGEYRVGVDVGTLPERFELTTPGVQVRAVPGPDEPVGFGIWERPRPVVVVYRPPVADFTWDPASPRAGQPVTFDARASLGRIESYRWDFTGDGEADAEGSVVLWTFPEPGVYLVTLVVTDDVQLTGETRLLVQVGP